MNTGRLVSVLDDRTCDSCRAAEGGRVSEVGTPPRASCSSPIGCRCWVEPAGECVHGVVDDVCLRCTREEYGWLAWWRTVRWIISRRISLR